jgi:hypothetical protein
MDACGGEPSFIYKGIGNVELRSSGNVCRCTEVFPCRERVHDATLMIGAYRSLATTFLLEGDFKSGLQHARHGACLPGWQLRRNVAGG